MHWRMQGVVGCRELTASGLRLPVHSQTADFQTRSTSTTLAAAAPYVMLDGENGQSTYRLAHQTFVEHFRTQGQYGLGHRKIAIALSDRYASAQRSWIDANIYVVRYITEHLVASEGDEIAPDAELLIDVVTSGSWLRRAMELLGVDQTVNVIRAAKVAVGQNEDVPLHHRLRNVVHQRPLSTISAFHNMDVLERTLRRSRVALSHDPAQLPGQLHARLKGYGDGFLAGLGDGVGRFAADPWLRMIEGSLDWRADLESTYVTTGKVRGLGLGQVGDRPVVAIAVDTRVELWDPRTGVPDVAATIELGHRPTAVAVSVIRGRPVIVTSAGYDELLEIWDARTGKRIAAANIGLGNAIAVGLENGRLVIAGATPDGHLKRVDAVSLQPLDGSLEERDVRGFGIGDNGKLFVLAVERVRETPRRYRILLVDPTYDEQIGHTVPIDSASYPDVLAAARLGGTFVIAAGIASRLCWFSEGHANAADQLYGLRTSAIALGVVDGRGIVISSPDYDNRALVRLQQLEIDAEHGVTLSRQSTAREAFPLLERFRPLRVPAQLGRPGPTDASGNRPLSLTSPENWPLSATASGVWDGLPVLATGSVSGSIWIWDLSSISQFGLPTARPRAVAGPFMHLPSTDLDRAWDLVDAGTGVDLATSVSLGDLPGRGGIVAVACGGRAQMYSLIDGERIRSLADEAEGVDCVCLGRMNKRTVLVTGSTNGNLIVWDVAEGTRIAGRALLDAPVKSIRIEAGVDLRIGSFSALHHKATTSSNSWVPGERCEVAKLCSVGCRGSYSPSRIAIQRQLDDRAESVYEPTERDALKSTDA